MVRDFGYNRKRRHSIHDGTSESRLQDENDDSTDDNYEFDDDCNGVPLAFHTAGLSEAAQLSERMAIMTRQHVHAKLYRYRQPLPNSGLRTSTIEGRAEKRDRFLSYRPRAAVFATLGSKQLKDCCKHVSALVVAAVGSDSPKERRAWVDRFGHPDPVLQQVKDLPLRMEPIVQRLRKPRM